MPAWVVPAAIAGGTIIANWLSARRQSKENRKFAEYQNLVNSQQLQSQLDYNTPKNQMARFQEAGLNPHLIYGQGNPGNQSQPLSYPDTKPGDFQKAFSEIGPLLNQSLMTQSQVSANDAKTRQTYVLTQLNQLQKDVLEKNPLLDTAGFRAIISGLISSAEIKAADSKIRSTEADWFSGDKSFNIGGKPMHGPAGVLKMETELKLLEQRFSLGSLDAKIKSEVVTSKEFQNALLEIQKKWMADGEITPQHILQFIQLFLMKML